MSLSLQVHSWITVSSFMQNADDTQVPVRDSSMKIVAFLEEEKVLKLGFTSACENTSAPRKMFCWINKNFHWPIFKRKILLGQPNFCWSGTPPSTSFWAQPLVGPRTNSSTSMPYPGFEPGTFGSAAGFPNHFTACRLTVIESEQIRQKKVIFCNWVLI